MKKIISMLLSFLLFASIVTVSTANAVQDSREYFEDGSYICIDYGSPEYWESTDSEEEQESDSISIIRRIINFIKDLFKKLFGKAETEPENTVKTIGRTKYAAYYDSNDKLLWTVYLHANFTYDGEKSECTSSRVSSESKDSDWKVVSAIGYYDSSKATGEFTVQQYKLGVKLKTVERTLTLTCDKNGNVK